MQMVRICPACGSETIVKHREIESVHIEGSFLQYEATFYECKSCGEQGDFFNESESPYLATRKEVEQQFINALLDELKEKRGIGMAAIERVFELPARTLSRYRLEGSSASGIALMRIIKRFPWIIEEMDRK